VLALGDMAKYFHPPTILTTSFENGPNGPLVPELSAVPGCALYCSSGKYQCLDNEDFVNAVKATGKAADYRRGGDRGLRGVSGAVGD
jgi:hypothetical protein